jgi:predicted  nucleic acid-binding Zn-ribbon protein
VSRSQQLYQLQLLDTQLDEANQELARIEAALSEDEAVQQARAAVDTAGANLRKAQATMLDLELEVKSLTDKINQQEKMLYSGSVTSSKEAANLQEEVASLKRWHAKREELLLEAMVEVEELEAEAEQAQAALNAAQEQWSNTQVDLHGQQETLRAQVSELQARRPVLIGAIDADDIEEYEALRPRKGGRAVAAVKNGVCQGCGMGASNANLTKARSNEELAYCDICGRILHIL